MYGGHVLFVRISIVLGMVAAVATILYFSPLPDQRFLSCNRPCHEYDWPMICRIKLTIGNYSPTLSKCDTQNCTSLGEQQIFLPQNKQLLKSSIQVCQNDVLVVDVINKIPGQSVTIHWRGQPQNEVPSMDGVPMVTQCPISSYTTFQYKFRASSPGTHLWQAHSGSEVEEGIFGALIVRQARKMDPNRKYYDFDNRNHVLLISKLGESLLINGVAFPENIKLMEGKRYRFRIAYSGHKGCPITLSLERHLLKVIALDGNPITPYEVSSISLSKGERVDFVLKTNQVPDEYFLELTGSCHESNLESRIVVVYENVTMGRKLVDSKEKLDLGNRVLSSGSTRKFDTSFCESKLGRVCISDVHSLTKIPFNLAKREVEKKIYFEFSGQISSDSIEGKPGRKVYAMNNISFTYPSSPLLTQRSDVNDLTICNFENKPKQCSNEEICECVHVEQIPVDSTVELLLIDQGGADEETIFHLHGYKFYVVGHTIFDVPKKLEEIKRLDNKSLLFKRNLVNPALKDTIRIPKFGVAAVRFIASNPGYWMLRDEHSKSWTRGLDVVLQVGDNCDMVTKPSNFPTCGSWVGPNFFLV